MLPTTPGTQLAWTAGQRRGPRQLLRHLGHLARRRPAWCAYCPPPAPLVYLSPAGQVEAGE